MPSRILGSAATLSHPLLSVTSADINIIGFWEVVMPPCTFRGRGRQISPSIASQTHLKAKPNRVGVPVRRCPGGGNHADQSMWFAPWLSELYPPTKTLEVLHAMFTEGFNSRRGR